MPTIVLTDFVKERLFDPKKGGTCITDRSAARFEKELGINLNYPAGDFAVYLKTIDGYAPFCKLFVFLNWTDANAGTSPITEHNKGLLRSDYIARNDNELPVLSRWIEMSFVPVAEYLVVVAYDKKQMAKEGLPINEDWGVVAVLGQMHPDEEPMPPITMMRNALGVSEGGSGVKLDREAYLKSVEFWKNNAIVKRPLTESEG